MADNKGKHVAPDIINWIEDRLSLEKFEDVGI